MKSSEFLRLLKRHGWYVIRQTGSHMIMRHDLRNEEITFPYHGSKELTKGLEMKLRKIAGI
jgi:mRNA interferase HicA